MGVFQRMNQWFASSDEQELAHFELDSMEWERRVFPEEVEVGVDFFWDWDEDQVDHSTEEKWVYGFHEPELGLHFFVTKEKVKSPMAEDLAGLYPLDNLTEKQKEIYLDAKEWVLLPSGHRGIVDDISDGEIWGKRLVVFTKGFYISLVMIKDSPWEPEELVVTKRIFNSIEF